MREVGQCYKMGESAMKEVGQSLERVKGRTQGNSGVKGERVQIRA